MTLRGAATALVPAATGFLAGGGSGAALVSARAARRAQRRAASVADLRETQDRLLALREAARLRALRADGAPPEYEIAALADRLSTAADRTLSPAVVRRALRYGAVARRWSELEGRGRWRRRRTPRSPRCSARRCGRTGSRTRREAAAAGACCRPAAAARSLKITTLDQVGRPAQTAGRCGQRPAARHLRGRYAVSPPS